MFAALCNQYTSILAKSPAFYSAVPGTRALQAPRSHTCSTLLSSLAKVASCNGACRRLGITQQRALQWFPKRTATEIRPPFASVIAGELSAQQRQHLRHNAYGIQGHRRTRAEVNLFWPPRLGRQQPAAHEQQTRATAPNSACALRRL